MSGSTIGGIVGGGIGFLIGGPAGARIGWMAGSLIGSVVAPEKIYGPRLKDAQNQPAQDGVPRSYGYGSFPTTGVLLWRDPSINEHKKEDGGKGGPTQVTYTYTRSYAIGICRGPIGGILLVEKNGKIVYDARTNAELEALGYTAENIKDQRAAQAKFLEVAKFYYGDEEQLPDPTIQAVEGASNVPAYRGTAYLVMTDDETNQGEVGQFRFVIAQCGSENSADDGGEILITGSAIEVGGPVFALAETADVPVPVAIPTSTGATLAGATATYGDGTWVAASKDGTRYLAGTLSTSASWSTGTLSATNDIEFVEYGGTEWAAKERGAGGSTASQAFSGSPVAFTTASPVVYDTLGNVLTTRFQMLRYIDGYWYGSLVRSLHRSTTMAGPFSAVWDGYKNTAAGWDNNGACIIGFYDGVKVGERTYFIVEWHFNVGLQRHRIWWSPDGGVTMSEANIEYDAAYATAGYKPVQLIEVGGKIVALCDDFGVLTNANGTFERVETGMPTFPATGGAQDVEPWLSRRIATDGGRVYIVGGSYMVVSLDKGRTWGDPIALPIASAKGIAIGNTSAGTDVPDAPGWKYDGTLGLNGGSYTSIEQCIPTLGDIVSDQCESNGVTSYNVDELVDEVPGYRVASETSPQRNIQSLQAGYFFDGSEYDGILHFPKRGGEASFTLTIDDIASRDGEPIEWERTQEAELLRKVTVGYIDPATSYHETTQFWERRTGTIQALGEGTKELPVVNNKDWAKQAAEKSVKVAWAETETLKFSVTVSHSYIVPAQVGTITDISGITHRIRITKVEEDGGIFHIEAVRERSNTYNSSATGIGGPSPKPPGSGIRGPTDSVILNVPVLRDDDDRPGVYWAASGLTDGWSGAVLQLQRGGSWETVAEIDAPCIIGSVTADIQSFDGVWDTVNTLHVSLNDDVSSLTFSNLLREGNPIAVVYPDGTAEIVQFQSAVEDSPGEWSLTNIIRGRMDTVNGAHETGARAVVLDASLRFVQLRKDDLGKTLTFRAVSIGTDPDAAPTQTLTLTTMESQREWQPWNVQVEVTETCEHRVTFIGRHRLGTDLNPVQSQWFKGWRIDFTLNGVTHSRMTQEESFLYTREMQVEDWGVALCASYDVAVYAVNEYTGTDGAGNPTANDDEPFAVTGNLPDGYVGSTYRMFSGDAGFVLTGKSQATYNDAFGLVGSGVTAHGPEPYSVGFVTRGTPLAAGTYVTDINAGSVGTIAQSVDFAAKPTYSLLDMRWRGWSEGRWADTTPPLTTQVYEADQRSGTGSMWTLAALDSSASNTHVEFVITGAPVYIGINANMPAELTDAAFFAGIVYAGANTAAYLAAAGTYAIELVPSTGAWEIIKLGTGVVASGTLTLPSGNRYRFGYTVPEPQDSTVHFNAGNETWLVTATGGFGGMAHPSVVVPVMWLDTSPANSITFGTFGKSSGQWRVQVGGRYRSGLAASGFDEANGLPGDTGADDSIVFDGATLRWTFGGVASFVDLVWPPSAEPAPVYAVDFAASTVKVCRVDYATGVVSVVHTITGLPAGTWLPFDFRGYLSKQIKHNPAGPAGYSDWTTTL